jgi:hypothetical protein
MTPNLMPATERDPDCPNCKRLEQQIEGLKLSLKRENAELLNLMERAKYLADRVSKRRFTDAVAISDALHADILVSLDAARKEQGKRHAS